MSKQTIPKNPILFILHATVAVFASLRLTITLLALAIVLIFFGTLALTHMGIQEMQKEYIHSFITHVEVMGSARYHEQSGEQLRPELLFQFWMPGGHTLGGLLLINLFVAHFFRFKLTWKKSGIWLTHLGLIILIIGELITGLYSEESNMTLVEGTSRNYTEMIYDTELAFVESTSESTERHFVFPQQRLQDGMGETLTAPNLPFNVKVEEFIVNAWMLNHEQSANLPDFKPVNADRGIGPSVAIQRRDRTGRMDEFNLPATLVTLSENGENLGTWITWVGPDPANPLVQRITSNDGREFDLSMRLRRTYLPFSIGLNQFRHQRYPGTEIPKDFSSWVTVTDQGNTSGLNYRIWMNNPLRHGGYTFYQHSHKPDDEITSILLVVKNPAVLIPYISCIIITLGLCIQFGISLERGIRRKSKSAKPSPQTA